MDLKSENIFQYFDNTAEKINKGSYSLKLALKYGSILVHCGAGVSRVPYFVNSVSKLGDSLFD